MANGKGSEHYATHVPHLKILSILPQDQQGDANNSSSPAESGKKGAGDLHPRSTAIIEKPEKGLLAHLMWSQWQLMLATLLVPAGFSFLLFGVIPLGQPNETRHQKSVWIFVTNAITFTVFNTCILILWLACLDEEKPWRKRKIYIGIALVSYAIQAGVMFGIFSATDETFTLFGVVPFGISIVSVLIMTELLQPIIWKCGCTYYRDRLKEFYKMLIALFTFIVALSAWVILFREIDARDNLGGAIALPFMLLIIVFAWKKIFLALTDQFPIEIAMLISGLWLENMDDVFQTLVFPAAADFNSYASFLGLWLRKLFENLAYMGFLTNTWFRFRVWIKAYLKGKFTGKTVPKDQATPIDSDVIDDRGHSNVKPGYFRRQIQFLLYKIFSQCSASIFYLVVAPILRWGLNSEFYPLAERDDAKYDLKSLSDEDFRNTMFFAAISLLTSLFTGLLAYCFIKRRRYMEFNQLKQLYGSLFMSPVYYGFVFVIFVSSQVLGVGVLQYHNRIWFYNDPQP